MKREEEVTQSAPDPATERACADGAYQPPRAVHVGKTSSLIRGYWRERQADYQTGWYITGE